jgi:hypothetical protein
MATSTATAATHTRKKSGLDRQTTVKHYENEEETRGVIDFINSVIKDANIDPESDEIAQKVEDGVLLHHLMNAIEPGIIKRPAITKFRSGQEKFQKIENLKAVLDAAKELKCQVINVGPNDFLAGTSHLIMGVLWQIVRVGLLKRVAELANTELPAEEILLKWFNYHLAKSGANRKVSNFSNDLQDGFALTYLLHSLDASTCPLTPLQAPDNFSRAEQILKYADQLGCRKFVSPNDIVKGNGRLNLAFIATLFSKYPDMGQVDEAPKAGEDVSHLKKKIVELSEEVVELKHIEDDLSGEVDKLKKENKDLKEEISELHLQTNYLNEQLDAKGDQVVADYKAREEKLTQQLKDKEEEIKEILLREEHRITEKLKEKEEELRKEFDEREQQTLDEIEQRDAARRKHKETVDLNEKEWEERQEEMAKQIRAKEELLSDEKQAHADDIKRLRDRIQELEHMLELSKASERELKSLMNVPDEINGFLFRKTSKNRMVKRYCILRGEYLLFYRSENPSNQVKTNGAIYLSESNVNELDEEESQKATGNKKMKAAFEIETEYSNRKYILCAKSEEERDVWIRAINETKKWFAAQPKSGGSGNKRKSIRLNLPASDSSSSESE